MNFNLGDISDKFMNRIRATFREETIDDTTIEDTF